MEDEKKRIFGYWFLAGFLLMIPFSIYIAVPKLERAYDLSNNAQTTYGTVLDIYSCEKEQKHWHFGKLFYLYLEEGSIHLESPVCNRRYVEGAVTYQYNVNQKVFKGIETVTVLSRYKVGAIVPIIYSSKNPENSKLQ